MSLNAQGKELWVGIEAEVLIQILEKFFDLIPAQDLLSKLSASQKFGLDFKPVSNPIDPNDAQGLRPERSFNATVNEDAWIHKSISKLTR